MKKLLSLLVLTTVAIAPPALAGDDDHLSETQGLRVLHAWTTPADDGALKVFMEIENTGSDPVVLEAGSTEAGAATELVGIDYASGSGDPAPIGAFEIPAGADVDFEPDGLYIQVSELASDPAPGASFDLTLTFTPIGDLEIHVEVLDPGTTKHPHAGHNH